MTGRKIGPFRLESQLGVGGMGIVYLATYEETGQKVAVKVLTPALSADRKLLARFEREMKILRKLRHRNIVRYFGGGKSAGQHFYAMEVMDGGSLESVLEKKGRLSWEQTIDVALQIAKGLEHAHHHGIIHRDLKPANVFLSKDGKIKLGDFGIARDTEATALTAAGKTVGTYAYMAPEQIVGKPPVSGRTDLYALGCVMFQMLTGRIPFEADTPAEMLFKHIEDEPPRVSSEAIDCPVWLEEIVDRLLAKAPEDRFYDALATQVALQEVGEKVAEQASIAKQTVAGGPTKATAAGDRTELQKLMGKKKKKKRKKQPLHEQAWFLALCLGLLIGGVTWLLWPLSEATLYARAQVLMQSDSASDHLTARDKYLAPLIERFPEGEHAAEAREWIDQIETDKLDRQVETSMRIGREPRSEAERLYMEARRLEKDFGDRVTALEKYQSLRNLFREQEEARFFLRLADRRIREIELSGDADVDDRVKLVNAKLKAADEHARNGKLLPARRIWKSVITAYSSNQELKLQVEYAQLRMQGEEVEPIDFDDPGEPSVEDPSNPPEPDSPAEST